MGHDHVTRHGFRSTFRDWATKTGPEHWAAAEYALMYCVRDATTRAYQRGDLLEERRILLTD